MDDQKKKNPWAQQSGNNSDRPSWNGDGGGQPPPDLDELFRRIRSAFGRGPVEKTGLVILAVLLLWLASGFYTVDPGENAVIQRFGALSRTQTDAGLGYRLPWPIETLTKVNVAAVRRMGIGFAEADTGKQDIPEESLMLTSDANIVSIDLEVHWNIKSAQDFLFNISDPENTIKKVAESAIREVVGQAPMFPIITTDRDAIAQRAREIMTKNLDEYKSGVNITQVLIREAEVHPDVQEAFQDVQSAKQDAFDAQNRAGVYREDILPKARGDAIKTVQDAQGYKQSVIAKATGDAARFNATYAAYLAGPDVTKKRMYIETMEDVLGSAQKIIIDDNAKSVVPYLPLTELKPAAGTATSGPSP